jgi:hypothetical protein
VFHRPTGETWIVAFADPERGELVPCGWPLTFAKLSDCELREQADDDEHEALLLRLYDMNDQSDPRSRYAQRVIDNRRPEAPSADQQDSPCTTSTPDDPASTSRSRP